MVELSFIAIATASSIVIAPSWSVSLRANKSTPPLCFFTPFDAALKGSGAKMFAAMLNIRARLIVLFIKSLLLIIYSRKYGLRHILGI